MSHADTTATAVGTAALEAELAAQGEQLTRVRDRALQVAGAVGYGATAYVRDFLSRFGLAQDGPVTAELPDGFQASHYSESGLQHQLELAQERHAAKLAGIRAEALRYYTQSRISLEQLNGFLEYAGMEQVAQHTTFTYSGQLSLSSELPQAEVTRLLREALAGIEGISEVNDRGVRASSSTHVH